MALDTFHPAVASWFGRRFAAPTPAQLRAWPAIAAGRNALIAAPTGSGKTLAAFLAAIDTLVREGLESGLRDETHVVYVSPLKALSNDVQVNLEEPLAGIREELAARGLADVAIRTAVRTGDTPAAERAAATKRPPHLFVTTPESLYILLTSDGGRAMLASARTVIVDEIHALVGTKRGSHLALSLERLEALAGRRLVRVGLSATQRPIEEVARFLVGAERVAEDGTPDCEIVDTGHARRLDLAIEVPDSPLQPVMSKEVWGEVYDRIAQLVQEHRTTLVFVNTRRLAERAARDLAERLGEEHVTSHHGSLSREQRLRAEQSLKAGRLRALVATSSLELGIDVGDVDLVCQLGSVRAIGTLLQRVGRSGHAVGGLPKGRLFPLTRDELVEAAALLDAVRRGELDRLTIPEQALDILAQQVVAAVAAEEWTEDALFALIRRAWPYRRLARADFDAVVTMLAEGFTTRRGRRAAHVYHDAVNGRLRARRGAKLLAITSGGAIPDTADYDVVLEPAGVKVGTVNEDFAVETIAGDIFQLGNTSWRVVRVEMGKVRVEDAKGQPPTMPFWLGEAPSRTLELSHAVSRLRDDVTSLPPDEALEVLVHDIGVTRPAAEQVVEYLGAAKAALGVLPSEDVIVLERFFDESGGMQLVLHSPRGSRLNRAWGLALRKRFCRKFNFELQAAASEDSIVLSLGPTHSFPLDDVFSYLHSSSVRDVLTQAMLAAPLFTTRWRWNVTRALAVPRHRGGKRVPPALLRMQADDLMSLVFPDQLACPENLAGEREIPDHPLVRQTVRDGLEEAMDVAGLEELLRSIERGEKRLVAVDLPEPSPFAAEILSIRPFGYLDDAPLEERRTQAVMSRRWLDPETAADVGALDVSAIDAVRSEAWPSATTADELHDALCVLGYLTHAEVETNDWTAWTEELTRDGRATRASVRPADPAVTPPAQLWVAAERLPQLLAACTEATLEHPLRVPERHAARTWSREEALVELVRGRLEGLGPMTAAALAASASLPVADVEQALLALEQEGFVLRGRFTADADATQWCERRLLARIQRRTLNRLRQEIEPVTAADFMRFLLAWQHASPEHRMSGVEGLASVLRQLEGFEAPAAAWEADILPTRLERYDPTGLDALCLSGRVTWARLSPRAGAGAETRAAGPVRTTPIALTSRADLPAWSAFAGAPRRDGETSAGARAVVAFVREHGASFAPEIAHGTGLLATQLEDALGELVALGLASCDGFAGLRALLQPQDKRPPAHRRVAPGSVEAAGRWTLVRRDAAPGADDAPGAADAINPALVETIARALLRRYGVVYKVLLPAEDLLPPWRDLLRVYHRLEARGEVRGGRFVGGTAGEQFALPEAIGLMRSIRRERTAGALVSVSAADPLNLVGVVTPGPRVPALSGNRVLYRDGIPIAVREAGATRVLVDLDPVARWDAEKALLRRTVRAPSAAVAVPAEGEHAPA